MKWSDLSSSIRFLPYHVEVEGSASSRRYSPYMVEDASVVCGRSLCAQSRERLKGRLRRTHFELSVKVWGKCAGGRSDAPSAVDRRRGASLVTLGDAQATSALSLRVG